jgi:hypothetical protein
MERIHIHSALVEINKLASLRPRVLDLRPYVRHIAPAIELQMRSAASLARPRFTIVLPT